MFRCQNFEHVPFLLLLLRFWAFIELLHNRIDWENFCLSTALSHRFQVTKATIRKNPKNQLLDDYVFSFIVAQNWWDVECKHRVISPFLVGYSINIWHGFSIAIFQRLFLFAFLPSFHFHSMVYCFLILSTASIFVTFVR